MKTLTVNQMQDRVFYSRKKEFSDGDAIVNSSPVANCDSNDERLFTQFNITVNIEQNLEKIVGFGHPDLIQLVHSGSVNCFIDATFKCVPKGYEQCLVFMIRENRTGMYIPIFHILMTSKKEDSYFHAIQNIISACQWRLEAKSVTVDFEKALMKAVMQQFRDTPINGCLFHFKQALKRKLKDIAMPKEKISELLCKLNILTQISKSEIELKGIQYIRSEINESGLETKYNEFWRYFIDTWMKLFPPNLWNVSELLNDEDSEIIANRTNNGLERYNRTLNENFQVAHPTIAVFVQVIKKLQLDCLKSYNEILRGTRKRSNHQDVTVFDVPSSYNSFIPVAQKPVTEFTIKQEYMYLLGSMHFDNDDKQMYEVIGIDIYRGNVVCQRKPIKFGNIILSKDAQNDVVSVKEVLHFMNLDGESNVNDVKESAVVEQQPTKKYRSRKL